MGYIGIQCKHVNKQGGHIMIETQLLNAIKTIHEIIEDQHKQLVDHHSRIISLEAKLQVYAKTVSGIDLDKICSSVAVDISKEKNLEKQ